ncbi:uncharacterized protein LOC135138544 [Zophobas morio]|uniref:uncharacterized protein LOC135138544 n=1 Tax=Zophobas morio TaxID=2755281 RepID=UPI0030836687
MTTILVFLTTVAAASCFDWNGPIKVEDDRFQKCVEESGYQLDQEEPFSFKDAPTLELLCLMKCVSETLEILDEKGNIVEENLTEFDKDLPEEKYSMFKDCVKDSPQIAACQDMDYFLQCLASLQ